MTIFILLSLTSKLASFLLHFSIISDLSIRSFSNKCLSVPSSICIAGGEHVLAANGKQIGLVASFNFDDALASDTSGMGAIMSPIPKVGPAAGGLGASADFSNWERVEIFHNQNFESEQVKFK